MLADIPLSLGSTALNLALSGAGIATAPFSMAGHAGYFKYAQDKINNMGYYCDKLPDPKDQLDCQQQLLDHKKLIHKQFMSANSPAAVAPPSTTPTEPAFAADEDNKALKEDAAGGAWKGALVGGPVMNAVVNSRINKMYYACNDLPSPAKESCMAEMKRKYMEIMKANGVMPTDPVSGPVGGFAKGLIAGLPVSVGSAALDLAVPGASLAIAPFNMAAQAAYFKHAQDKINNMGYYCEKLLDPNDQLDCQQQLLDHKKMIYKQFMGVGDNSPAAVAPTSTPTEPAIPAAIEESFLNRFNYKKKVK